MNQQHKQGYMPIPTPGDIQGAPNQAKATSGYEKCENACNDRKDESYHDVQNSGMPAQKRG